MNESETRAELIDPELKESGWGVVEGSKVLREFRITPGKGSNFVSRGHQYSLCLRGHTTRHEPEELAHTLLHSVVADSVQRHLHFPKNKPLFHLMPI